MVLQAPPVHRHKVQILTINFQFSGQLETVGPVSNFLNDSTRNSLSLYEASLTPLAPGIPMGSLSRPHVVIRKPQIVFLYLASAEARASIRPFARRELLVAYTPVAVCRGYFHLSAEANVRDFVDTVNTDLLPITEAHVFPFNALSAPFPTEADLLLAGRAYLQFYHPA